ncbi:M23 family metallopeptidase [Tenacibaculum sp. MAR_2009_124]|nr:M23 family metallopeptidase [Tenacibaculum sp. MAR_2009_124]
MKDIYIKKTLSFLRTFFKDLSSSQALAIGFFIIIICFTLFNKKFSDSPKWLMEQKSEFEKLSYQLSKSSKDSLIDSLFLAREQKIIIKKINKNIGVYLYKLNSYSYINVLEPYLIFVPAVLDDIPSIVPLEKGDYQLSSNFGTRFHPIDKKYKKHYGIDLAGPVGKEIYASANGFIIEAKLDKNGYGHHVIIQHRFGFQTLYAHMD